MNLYKKLVKRAEAADPIRVGLIGAGKFGTMFLSQARLTPGIHVVGVADMDLAGVHKRLTAVGWKAEQFGAANTEDALRSGTTYVTDEAETLIRNAPLEVLIEATGDPGAGIKHCLLAIGEGLHVVMVNVEADVVAGPLLAYRAQQAGVIYSLAWGDQPALICEHVDWARACGFEVVCAGKGTRYHPTFHQSTPETVWDNFQFDREMVERGGMNPMMFNSFIDGTKSAIEMTAVCNATGLIPQQHGLSFPPTSCWELAQVCKPKAAGGALDHAGTTEVVSCLYRDMTPVENDLMFGTYVIISSENEYVRRCFTEYRMLPDQSGQYAALFRPTHMIGLELGISIASVVGRGEPTGSPTGFRSDVVAVAKKNLKSGRVLDGEGGYCVWGKQTPASKSIETGGLPIGLARGTRLKCDIEAGMPLRWQDVDHDQNDPAVKVRREMEANWA